MLNHGGSIDVNTTVVLNAHMARTDPQLKLRLPPSLKDWVDQRAEKNRRSLNAEIVHILEGVRDEVPLSPDDYMGKEEFLEWLKENPPPPVDHYEPTQEEVERERISCLWKQSETLSNDDLLEILKYRLSGVWKT